MFSIFLWGIQLFYVVFSVITPIPVLYIKKTNSINNLNQYLAFENGNIVLTNKNQVTYKIRVQGLSLELKGKD